MFRARRVPVLVVSRRPHREDERLAGTLYALKGYNGWGYRLFHPHVLTPYRWSGSTQYTSGKYVADGTWSDTATSRQIGAAVPGDRTSEAYRKVTGSFLAGDPRA